MRRGWVLSLAGDILAVVAAAGPEAKHGHGLEPLPVLQELVQGPHALGDDHVAFVEPGDLERRSWTLKISAKMGKLYKHDGRALAS